VRKLWLLLAVPIVALDQWVKWWVRWWPSGYLHDRSLLPGIRLTYTENTGAAFSMLDGGAARWFLVAVSSLAVIFIILAVCKRWIPGLFGIISISCVLGGAAGNLIDRASRGYVVDMFEFTFVNFAIFNVADVFITVGGICFCLRLILEMRKKEPDAVVDEDG
jgi:signal peptidase II